ncbi:tautomerase family protein [Zoogloea sp.]|uniref:tautomerase family protein n=1 Tax=Zoogloea sp. TaxID=49181 RepID=UPI00261648AC|nr:tautomerase family protein [uncultured Zoogloea sp.]
MEGRSEEQKRAVIEKVTAALVEVVGAPMESVRVIFTEIPKSHGCVAGTSAKNVGH